MTNFKLSEEKRNDVINMSWAWDGTKKKKRLRFFLSFVAQWLEHPTGIQKVIGSIPIGYSEFFFVPCSWHVDHIISHCFCIWSNLSVTDSGFQVGWGPGLENRFSHPFGLEIRWNPGFTMPLPEIYQFYIFLLSEKLKRYLTILLYQSVVFSSSVGAHGRKWDQYIKKSET